MSSESDKATFEVAPSGRRSPAFDDTHPEAGHPAMQAADSAELDGLPVVPSAVYELREEFGGGGIGRITEARDKRLHRVVAIKELRRSSGYARSRFAREIRITAALSHPNIVPLYEAGRWPSGEPFFAMKLVEGSSLEEAITSCVTWQDRLRVLRHVIDAAEAMAYAHSHRIIHRDLKPNNVLVGPFGETMVIDWGLAKNLDDPRDDTLPDPEDQDGFDGHQTQTGVVLGTPAYMPPEQALGEPVDERADVYALGAILYQVLSGKMPYVEHEGGDILARVSIGPPTPLEVLADDVPADLLAIVHKAMSRNAADRYPSAEEMAKELTRFTTGRLVTAYEYTLGELTWRFVRRHRAAVAVAVLALAALVGGGVYSLARIQNEATVAMDARAAAETAAAEEQAARAAAEHQLGESILARASSALETDPTTALALLRKLPSGSPRAASIAADAIERGVARHVLAGPDGHDDQIDVVAFSPDGRHVASAGWDNAVRLWDVHTGEARKLTGHADRVPTLAFSGDGRWLATSSYDRSVRVWETATGRSRNLGEHERTARAVALSSDAASLVSVGEASVAIWEVATGRKRQVALPGARPLFAAISPDDTLALTGSHGQTLQLWSLTGGADRTIATRSVIACACFVAGGRSVAAAGADGSLRLHPVTGGPEVTLRAEGPPLETVACAPGSGHLATGSRDGRVELWDLAAETSAAVGEHNERVTAVVFSRDSRWLASASWDTRILVHDRETSGRRQLVGHGGVVSSLAFSPGGELLASGSWDTEVRLWPMEAQPRRWLQAHGVGVKAVDFSPDGRLLASGGHDDLVRLWQVDTGALVTTFSGHTDHVFRVRFSPDAAWVASSSDDLTVRLWSTGGAGHRVLRGHTADVEELAFSPDGKYLASAAEDAKVGLWRVPDPDAPPGDEVGGTLLDAHRGDVTAVAFTPDSRLLVSASRDRTIRLTATDGGVVQRVLTDHAGEVVALALSPNGEHIAALAGDQLVLWGVDGNTRRVIADDLPGAEIVAYAPDGAHVAVASARAAAWLCTLEPAGCTPMAGASTRTRAMAFAPDGLTLVTGGSDHRVRFWSVATGASRTVRGHGAPVFDVAVSPDGALVATASGDGTIGLGPLALPPAPERLATAIDEATSYRLVDTSAEPGRADRVEAGPTR